MDELNPKCESVTSCFPDASTVDSPMDLAEVSDLLEGLQDISCIDCGYAPLEYQALFEVEKLARLKHILDKQENGIEISYRCVRCRSCLDCKNSDKVDKIPLREEAELYDLSTYW